MQTFKLLGFSGSLRRHAYSGAVLASMADHLDEGVRLTIAPLTDVPLYNADLDGKEPPAGVTAFKAAIAAADGLVVCSPEYNYGIPGVLKNAIDWASRPGFKSPLRDKPVLIITVSPGTAGGVRAQHQIREAFSAVLARPVVRQHVAIPEISKKLADGRLVDPTTLEILSLATKDLVREISLLRRSG